MTEARKKAAKRDETGAMKIGLASRKHAAALKQLIAEVPAEVAWTACGHSAAERCALNRPDVLLLEGDAVAADVVRAVHAEGLAIVLVVDDPEARVHEVYAAMEAGAIDVARAPTLAADGSVRDPDRLLGKLRSLSRRVGQSWVRKSGAPFLLLAASTGGPEALARVLADLDRTVPARVLVAQHIDDSFASGLASWLGDRAKRRVEVIDDGALVDTRTVWLVRSDRQPRLERGGAVRYGAFDADRPFRPNIDVLFESAARAKGVSGVAALLTGMGDDGARGLLALRRSGWVTFAEDASSSVVYGMPQAAAQLGAAARVLPVGAIASAAAKALREASLR